MVCRVDAEDAAVFRALHHGQLVTVGRDRLIEARNGKLARQIGKTPEPLLGLHLTHPVVRLHDLLERDAAGAVLVAIGLVGLQQRRVVCGLHAVAQRRDPLGDFFGIKVIVGSLKEDLRGRSGALHLRGKKIAVLCLVPLILTQRQIDLLQQIFRMVRPVRLVGNRLLQKRLRAQIYFLLQKRFRLRNQLFLLLLVGRAEHR